MALLFESRCSPILVERRALMPLAAFGLIHGFHEWLEMFLDRSDFIVSNNPIFWCWFKIFIFTLSFGALFIFGLQVLYPIQENKHLKKATWIGCLSVYLLAFLVIIIRTGLQITNDPETLDAVTRYILAFPGASIAGIALFREAAQAKQDSHKELHIALLTASLGFFCLRMHSADCLAIPFLPSQPD